MQCASLSLLSRDATAATTHARPELEVCSGARLQEQLSARSAEGRRLRRKVLRGTVLVCVIAGYQGKRFIYERAHELGVRSVSHLCHGPSYGLDHLELSKASCRW